jgi:sulfur relay (sulfurtransferase) complex TusBCD TusD component (DsrE family)
MQRRTLLSRLAFLPALAGLAAGVRAAAVVPVGWPPLVETLQKVTAKKIQIYACGACSRARGVTEQDLTQWGAKFGNPTIFVGLVEWADRIITE